MTAPLDESQPDTTTSITMRLPASLVDRMEKRAGDVGLNRTQWTIKALDWVLTYLPTGIPAPQRDKVASAAPGEVAGTTRRPPYPPGHYDDRPPHPGSPYKKSNGFQMGGQLKVGPKHEHTWASENGSEVCTSCGEVK